MNYVGRTEGKSSGGESEGQIQKTSREERHTEMYPTQQMLLLTLAHKVQRPINPQAKLSSCSPLLNISSHNSEVT